MNVFLRELKSHWKGLTFWSIGMVLLIASGMAKYDTYQATGQSINQLLDQFPKAVQVILGMTGLDLTTAKGFYGLLFPYIAIMATIHAVLIGSDMIAKEERDKTSEFLLPKPVTRAKIITGKLLAGLINLIVFNIVTTVFAVLMVEYFNKGASVTNDILLLSVGLFLLQLVFFSVGTATAGINKKQKSSASLGAAVLLLTYILSVIASLSDSLEKLKYLSPFKYFEAKDILSSGKLDPAYMTLSVIIIIILITTTYYSYSRRDISV